MMDEILEAMKTVWQNTKHIFQELYLGFRKVYQYILDHIIITERFSYDINKAFYSKKKRIRKKYMKRLFVSN